MKKYYIDRKTKIKHFTDLSLLGAYHATDQISLKIPALENFVVQLAVVPDNEIEIKEISFSGNDTIYCLNTQIVDKFGKHSTKPIALQKNTIQPLFFILPAQKKAVCKQEKIQIRFLTDCGEDAFTLLIDYSEKPVENGGYNDIEALSRLHWLNSSRFLDDEVPAPYIVPEIQKNAIKILGREIQIGKNGLPEQVAYYFDESIQLQDTVQKEIFYSAMDFQIEKQSIEYEPVTFTQNKGTIYISCHGHTEDLEILTEGTLHYEGFIDYKIKIKSLKDLKVSNISLVTSINKACAKYRNGLGAVGGKAENLKFTWSDENHQDCLYVGDVNAGLRLKWKAENYRKPLVNIYYKNLPLVVPKITWDNHGQGEIQFKQQENCAKIFAQTHTFTMQAGEERSFNFELHFVPFKAIDFQKHYNVRYFHNNKVTHEIRDVDKASKLHLTHMVIHHGNRVHPFINYPFVEVERLKNLVEYAKTKQIGVKVYYTTREHSNHMAEVFAYKALGDEIILRQKGVGHNWSGGTDQWLTEYFGETIIPAWKVKYKWGKYRNDPDVSFIVRPDSRLDNYYVEGLDWLVQNIGIKGIYVDDTAMDRTTMERARKVLSKTDGLIDMHMWNHEEERAGNVSCMNLYTELFPFLDSLWIGEGYPYKKLSPDYLLTEVSGIPYGQTSQMLQDGGDFYIGMLYAMNNRYGWGVKNADHLYKLWDDFQIQNSEMRGYWHSKNPVEMQEEDVKVTTYIKEHDALLCLFNFAEKSKTVDLKINTELLGFTPNNISQVRIGKNKRKALSNNTRITLHGTSGKILYISE